MQRVQVLYQLSEGNKISFKVVRSKVRLKEGRFESRIRCMTVLLVNPTIANATTSNTSVIRGEYINNTGSSLRQRDTEYKTNVPADGRSINWYTLSLLNT